MKEYFVAEQQLHTTPSGTVTAKIYSNFVFPTLDAKVDIFQADEHSAALRATDEISENEWNTVIYEFPNDIRPGRHEFHEGSELKPPTFGSAKRVDGGVIVTVYDTDPRVGHVVIDFDLDNGTIKATFNCTILGTNSTRHQAVGEIEAKGLDRLELGRSKKTLG